VSEIAQQFSHFRDSRYNMDLDPCQRPKINKEEEDNLILNYIVTFLLRFSVEPLANLVTGTLLRP